MNVDRIIDGVRVAWTFGKLIWSALKRDEPPARIDDLHPGALTERAAEEERRRVHARWPDADVMRPPLAPAIEVAIPTTRPPGEEGSTASDDDFGAPLPPMPDDDPGDFPNDDDIPY